MLILTRRVGETLYVGDEVTVTVLGTKVGQVRIGIKAPKGVSVHREEVYRQIQLERGEGDEPGPDGVARILQALAFAADKHRHQRRKDQCASPYINHPIALADTLVNEGGVTDTDVLCAALLHDTIEDTDTTVEELEQTFGATVAGIVMEVTDDKTLPKAERKRRQVEHARHLSDAARLIKLADKISNLRDILAHPPADWDTARKRDYFDWAAQVVDGLRGSHPNLEAVFDDLYRRAPRVVA